MPGREAWEGSLSQAASDVVGPIASSPLTLVLAAWAALAVVLPLLLRGRWLALDCVGAAIWAAGVMVALAAVGDLIGRHRRPGAGARGGGRGAGGRGGGCGDLADRTPYGGLADPARDHGLGLPSGPI